MILAEVVQLRLLRLVKLLDFEEGLIAIHDWHADVTNDKLDRLNVYSAFKFIYLDSIEYIV